MGVKIIIHVRHIRGHKFDVEVNRDADCIGLKIAIWDSQKIPIETQRLVYAGKEIPDGSNMVELGIDDGSTIFLVERVVENAKAATVVAAPAVESQQVVDILVPEESVSLSGPPLEPMGVNSQRYAPLAYDRLSEERIQSTVDLEFWVRIYCVFGILVSVCALLNCWGSLVPLACYVLGYIGCRKLNRCCLIFPLLVSIVAGPIAFVFTLWGLATHFWPPMVAGLVVSFLHILIMASILKLGIRIKHLDCEEKCEAKERIRTRVRCCCC